MWQHILSALSSPVLALTRIPLGNLPAMEGRRGLPPHLAEKKQKNPPFHTRSVEAIGLWGIPFEGKERTLRLGPVQFLPPPFLTLYFSFPDDTRSRCVVLSSALVRCSQQPCIHFYHFGTHCFGKRMMGRMNECVKQTPFTLDLFSSSLFFL